MQMIWWVIFIIVVITIIAISLMVGPGALNPLPEESPNESPEAPVPTMHARCNQDTTCGGDLICDYGCHRCKQKAGGNCAGDVDCEHGLRCVNWKCGSSPPSQDDEIIIVPETPKHIRWDLPPGK